MAIACCYPPPPCVSLTVAARPHKPPIPMKNPEILNEFRALIEAESNGDLQELAQSLHPATLADYLNNLTPEEAADVVALLNPDTQADVLMMLDEEAHRPYVLDALAIKDLAPVITRMHHGDRVDLLQELDDDRANEALQQLARSEREDMQRLSAYEEGTVGAITTTEYVRLWPTMSTTAAIDQMREQAFDMETIYYGYVTDSDMRLVGTVSLKDLIMSRPDARVKDVMRTDVVSVEAEDGEMEAARVLSKYDLMAVPVLNGDGKMLGIATFDDVLDVLEEEATETMYRKAGIGQLVPSDERDVIYSKKLTQGSIWYPVRLRILFLLVTLVGGLLVGGVIDFYEDTLATVVAAAIFIPLIMDMGGNVGTQSTTIFARGIALGHIDVKDFGGQLLREVSVGVIMGVILGAIGGAVAYFWQAAPAGIPELAIAVGVALAVVIPLATLLGFLLPWVLVKIGVDHASGADPFMTTIKDFVSLALYFWLITVLVGLG